jgi:drug/metabolite transporter (DMT)-like permease
LFLNPLFIPLFSRCLNKEPILKWDFLAIVVGCVGMVLVIQPYRNVEQPGLEHMTP